jgi:predicted amidohydrolase
VLYLTGNLLRYAISRVSHDLCTSWSFTYDLPWCIQPNYRYIFLFLDFTTGPLHWELLLRARALDNQMNVVGCSPATGKEGYQAWGHSMVVDPMGRVVGEVDGGQKGVVIVDVDLEEVKMAREGIPVSVQRRFDVYPDVSK